MTQYEKRSWISLITTGIILFGFNWTMLDGWQVKDLEAQELFWIFVGTSVLFIVAEVVMFVTFAIRNPKHEIVHDERDKAIEAKAMGIGNFVMNFGIVAGLFVYISDAAFEDYQSPLQFEISTQADIFYGVFGLLLLSTLVERIAAIIYSR